MNENEVAEFVEAEEVSSEIKKPVKWYWYVKVGIRFLIVLPFLLIAAILFIIFYPKKRKAFRILGGFIVFCFISDSEEAKEKISELTKTLRYARAGRGNN